MIQQETITIPLHEYLKLKDAEAKLNALEFGGVDNWEWYGESMKQYWKERGEYDDEGDVDQW